MEKDLRMLVDAGAKAHKANCILGCMASGLREGDSPLCFAGETALEHCIQL